MAKKKTIRTIPQERTPMPEQDARERARNFKEVACGYTLENALRDAYGGQGHIFANIKASPRFQEEPGQLDLVYQIEEGDMFRVGKINIHVAGESPHTRRDVVLMNAAAGLVVGGKAPGLRDVIRLARESITSGKAMRCLEKLIELTHKLASS